MSRKGCIKSDTHEKGLVFSSCKYKRLERGPLRSLFAWASYGSENLRLAFFAPVSSNSCPTARQGYLIFPKCAPSLLVFSPFKGCFFPNFDCQHSIQSLRSKPGHMPRSCPRVLWPKVIPGSCAPTQLWLWLSVRFFVLCLFVYMPILNIATGL